MLKTIKMTNQLLISSLLFFSLPVSADVEVVQGWNLIGNDSGTAMNVTQRFADATQVVTVWKWNATAKSWSFYSPSLSATGLSSYATSKGYDVLSQINPGDGFWVNALQAFTFSSFATPTLTSTFPTTITGVNGTISATLTSDVNSLAYFAIVESTSTAPTAPRLIAGKNASNVAYSNKGKVLLSAGTPFTSSLSISTLIG